MKQVTRFNPTPTGSPLHAGHLYTALVNATEAHRNDGAFILRIDDTQEYWNVKLGRKLLNQFSDEFVEQLRRFMKIDKVEKQSDMPPVRDIIGNMPIIDFIPKPKFLHDYIAEWIPDKDMSMYPYAPSYTFEKVVWDFYDGVTWLIRGEDLVTEVCLYAYFADVIGLPVVSQTLLPRLRTSSRGELGVTTISKTFRNYALQKQIDKFGVEGVMEFLRKSCLINPDGEFHVENIKSSPIVVGFEP